MKKHKENLETLVCIIILLSVGILIIGFFFRINRDSNNNIWVTIYNPINKSSTSYCRNCKGINKAWTQGSYRAAMGPISLKLLKHSGVMWPLNIKSLKEKRGSKYYPRPPHCIFEIGDYPTYENMKPIGRGILTIKGTKQ